MKRLSKSVVCIFLTVVIVISILPISAFAATYRVNYWSYPVPSRTLSNGSIGNDVRWLQCALNALTFYGDKSGIRINAPRLNVDGDFGSQTRTAVLVFQRRYGLAQDGLFGIASRTKMRSVLRSNYSDPVYVADQQTTTQPDPEPKISKAFNYNIDGVYYIRNKQTNKYLDVCGGKNENRARIVQYQFHGDTNQQFEIKYENGFYKIYTKLAGNRRCLDLHSSSEANTNDTDLQLFGAASIYKEQNFILKRLGDGSYEIGSACSNGEKVLEVANSSYSDGAAVQIWQGNSSKLYDDWYLEPADAKQKELIQQAQNRVKSRHQYDSIDEAALDFIMAYNGMSVDQNREYGSTIIRVGNKYTFTNVIWGPVRYNDYGNLGDYWYEIIKINPSDTVAYVHTHGQATCLANLVFSKTEGDTDVVNAEGSIFEYAYLGNANGEFFRYTKGQDAYEDWDYPKTGLFSGDKLRDNLSWCASNHVDDTAFSWKLDNNCGIY